MKRTFPCGHKGQGKFCHRCKAAEALEKELPSGKPDIEKARQESVARLKAVPNRTTAPVPVA